MQVNNKKKLGCSFTGPWMQQHSSEYGPYIHLAHTMHCMCSCPSHQWDPCTCLEPISGSPAYSYWTELIIYEAKVITVSQFKQISSQHSDEIHVLHLLMYHPVHSPLGSFDLYYFLLINRMVIHVPQTCLKKRYLKISRVSSRTSGLF